jgi:hypothetical protein
MPSLSCTVIEYCAPGGCVNLHRHRGAIGPVEITQIPESEVITRAQAGEKLLPMVNPLPAYDPCRPETARAGP